MREWRTKIFWKYKLASYKKAWHTHLLMKTSCEKRSLIRSNRSSALVSFSIPFSTLRAKRLHGKSTRNFLFSHFLSFFGLIQHSCGEASFQHTRYRWCVLSCESDSLRSCSTLSIWFCADSRVFMEYCTSNIDSSCYDCVETSIHLFIIRKSWYSSSLSFLWAELRGENEKKTFSTIDRSKVGESKRESWISYKKYSFEKGKNRV